MRYGYARQVQPWSNEYAWESGGAVSCVCGFSANFLDPAEDRPIFEDDIIEEDVSCDLRKLASKDDYGASL